MKINDYVHVNENFDIIKFFDLCNKNDIQIEYVEDFDISNVTAMKYQRVNNLIYGEWGFFNRIDKALYSDDGGFYKWKNQEVGAYDFWMARWMLQSLLDDGYLTPFFWVTANSKDYNESEWELITKNISLSNDSYDGNEKSFHLHPGSTRVDCSYFLGIEKVSVMLFTKKSHGIDYGGTKIKSFEDLKGWCLEHLSGDMFHGRKLSIEIGSDDDFNDLNNPMKMIKFNMLLRGGDLRYMIWDFDSRESYSLIVKRSFPYKIYIGNSKSDEEFEQTCKRIQKSAINKPLDSKCDLTRKLDFFMDSLEKKGFKLAFERYDGNVNDIPEKNNFKGFCLYTDADKLWKRNVWEMFFLGNTNVAVRKLNDEVVFFNTEHASWKYTKNPSEHTKKLPKVYYE